MIATNVGGIPELIQNDVNGILVNPNESEQLLSEINELLTDKEKAKRLSEKGYEFVMNNLTWEVLLPKYVKFYEDVLKS